MGVETSKPQLTKAEWREERFDPPEGTITRAKAKRKKRKKEKDKKSGGATAYTGAAHFSSLRFFYSRIYIWIGDLFTYQSAPFAVFGES